MSPGPLPGHQQPSLAAFAEAQDRKRTLLGSDITFLWPKHVTFPPGTPTNPDSGQPFDPTIQGSASAQASATIRCSAFFKAINRGGASNAEIASPLGHDEKTRLFLVLASGDGLVVRGQASAAGGSAFAGFGEEAVEFEFHSDRFKIYSVKDDEIVLGYRRTLVYGAAIGTDEQSGFEP